METQPCFLQDCPERGHWSDWTSWSMCSVSCGGGQRSRQRACDNPPPRNGGAECAGDATQIDYCNEEACPVHGNWTTWTAWGVCTVTCGGGQQRRFRYCTNPEPSNNGRACIGSGIDTQSCNDEPCNVDSRWGPWSDWSSCSKYYTH